MERKDFFKTCGFACVSGSIFLSMLESCGSTKIISGTIEKSGLVIPASSFLEKENKYRKYIVVQNEKLQYPICLYRLNENEYSALLMRCTHQGAELQVFGDKLQCPAHGSEFSNHGIVQNGPASVNLRSFPVTVKQDQINISLK
ncbi:MAG: Rieske (2Fe-2S) protein [Bacteroidetes bacterium]|nr:Rieske (2Fe-2S) protein [Bacteroidota bacterium]MBS1974321.1 Rieske (2Fe-2S) protein [Bacteroidota bacterium]